MAFVTVEGVTTSLMPTPHKQHSLFKSAVADTLGESRLPKSLLYVYLPGPVGTHGLQTRVGALMAGLVLQL